MRGLINTLLFIYKVFLKYVHSSIKCHVLLKIVEEYYAKIRPILQSQRYFNTLLPRSPKKVFKIYISASTKRCEATTTLQSLLNFLFLCLDSLFLS